MKFYKVLLLKDNYMYDFEKKNYFDDDDSNIS